MAEGDNFIQQMVPPIPRPFLDSLSAKAQDKLLEELIENPLGLMDRANIAVDALTKVLPTLPGETIIPMPRGLYEKLKEKGSLPGVNRNE